MPKTPPLAKFTAKCLLQASHLQFRDKLTHTVLILLNFTMHVTQKTPLLAEQSYRMISAAIKLTTLVTTLLW